MTLNEAIEQIQVQYKALLAAKDLSRRLENRAYAQGQVDALESVLLILEKVEKET